MINEKTSNFMRMKTIKKVFIVFMMIFSTLYCSKTFAIDDMFISPYSKYYSADEIRKVTKEFSEEIIYFLKKNNKLDKVILLTDIRSSDYTKEELSGLFPVIKQELKAQGLNIIEKNESFQNKTGLHQSPSYYLMVRLFYRKIDNNKELKMASMQLINYVSNIVIWADDIYIYQKH